MTREAKYIEFGNRLRAARKSAGLTGPELAERAGVSPQAYQQWEAGKTMPRGSDRQKIVASALGLSVNVLFFAEPEPQPLSSPIPIWADEPAFQCGDSAPEVAFSTALAAHNSPGKLAGDIPEWAQIAAGLASGDPLPPVLQEVAKANGISGFGASSCTALALALAWELEKLRGK